MTSLSQSCRSSKLSLRAATMRRKRSYRMEKNNSQEVSLKDNSQSTDLRELFLRFWTDITNYLEKRFASLSSPPLSDFTVFDYRNFPVQRG